jgi:chaperonin GroES
MRVLGKKVVVRQALSDTQTPGGLALPDTMQSKLPMGTVITAGPDTPLQIVPGVVIQFNGYAGSPISVHGQEYVVIDAEDILVILEEIDK